MTATADGGPGAGSPGPEGADGANGAAAEAGGEAAVAYFRAIEDAFVRLRGAPLLLSPADFQVAARWQRDGVPLGLVLATLEEVFAKRRERGTRGRINSLRYCAPAVEEAWADVQELQGPARPEDDGAGLDVAERLAALAAALPDGSEWDAWRSRILALEGAAAEVEEALRGLDGGLVAELDRGLAADERERLSAEVEAIVEGLRDRFPDAELVALRGRLFRQRLRKARGVPVLSLF